jgi:O-antigen ligase
MLASLAWVVQIFARRVHNGSWGAYLESVAESLLRHGIWQTLGLVILGSALLFTHSRGGTVSTLLGITAMTVSAVTAPALRGPWRMGFVTLAVIGAVLIIALNGGSLLSRVVETSLESDLRFNINSGTMSAIGKNFLFGTGLGTFKYVYAPYQPPSVGALVDLAHDDYLENILELGVPAGIVFYSMLLLLVLECLRGVIRRRRNAIFPCLGLGASVLVGCHSAVDFSMQAPAVAVTYAALLGVGVAQSRGADGRSAREGSLPEAT